MSGVAVFRRRLRDGWQGDARLYQLYPAALCQHAGEVDFVIVSANVVPAALGGKCETFIFPAACTGYVRSMVQMDGSIVGALDHAAALRAAGYEVGEQP